MRLEPPTERSGGHQPPDPLMSIGVFARRSRLSMKALRLYERLGLLKPADVDPGNGYRRYRESQLFTARLIVMLRLLDMSLDQVGRSSRLRVRKARSLSRRIGRTWNAASSGSDD